MVVEVVDASPPGTEDVVELDATVVDVVGTSVVAGRIVSPGATVFTGFVVVVSPEAERFVVPLLQAANKRPQESATAIARAINRCWVLRVASMTHHRTHEVNNVDTRYKLGPYSTPTATERATGAARAPVLVAESEGFEPSVTRRPQRLSRPPHSSALATFRLRH